MLRETAEGVLGYVCGMCFGFLDYLCVGGLCQTFNFLNFAFLITSLQGTEVQIHFP